MQGKLTKMGNVWLAQLVLCVHESLHRGSGGPAGGPTPPSAASVLAALRAMPLLPLAGGGYAAVEDGAAPAQPVAKEAASSQQPQRQLPVYFPLAAETVPGTRLWEAERAVSEVQRAQLLKCRLPLRFLDNRFISAVGRERHVELVAALEVLHAACTHDSCSNLLNLSGRVEQCFGEGKHLKVVTSWRCDQDWMAYSASSKHLMGTVMAGLTLKHGRLLPRRPSCCAAFVMRAPGAPWSKHSWLSASAGRPGPVQSATSGCTQQCQHQNDLAVHACMAATRTAPPAHRALLDVWLRCLFIFSP